MKNSHYTENEGVALRVTFFATLEPESQWNHHEKDHAGVNCGDLGERHVAGLWRYFVGPNSGLETHEAEVTNLNTSYSQLSSILLHGFGIRLPLLLADAILHLGVLDVALRCYVDVRWRWHIGVWNHGVAWEERLSQGLLVV